jgi:hypothetical protein
MTKKNFCMQKNLLLFNKKQKSYKKESQRKYIAHNKPFVSRLNKRIKNVQAFTAVINVCW